MTGTLKTAAALVGAAAALTLGTIASLARSGLPPGARVIFTAPIQGVQAGEATVYQKGESYLRIAANGSATTRKLSGRVLSLTSPAAHLVTVETTSGSTRQLCAFDVTSVQTRSAFPGAKNGCTAAAQFISLHMPAISIHRADTSHLGKIRYQIVTRYVWDGSALAERWHYRAPDYPGGKVPVPNGIVKTTSGDKIAISLEVARTEAQQEHGLMDRHSMDPDAGMIFVWPQPVHESFWMENTYIPLSIAFLGVDGTVQEIQNMAALSTDLHTPTSPYQYAIEANLGFFSRNHIRAGDKYVLNLGSK